MKKIVITNYSEIGNQPEEDTLVAFGDESMDAHDGYHTFDELYECRNTLWITVCREQRHAVPWRSKVHSDGSVWDGLFLLGLYVEPGRQMTYHLPIDKWDETGFAETFDRAPKFDGHTSQDVINRLKKL